LAAVCCIIPRSPGVLKMRGNERWVKVVEWRSPGKRTKLAVEKCSSSAAILVSLAYNLCAESVSVGLSGPFLPP
jgi:hypothetical protein